MVLRGLSCSLLAAVHLPVASGGLLALLRRLNFVFSCYSLLIANAGKSALHKYISVQGASSGVG